MDQDTKALTDREREDKWKTIQALAWLCVYDAGHDIPIRRTDNEAGRTGGNQTYTSSYI